MTLTLQLQLEKLSPYEVKQYQYENGERIPSKIIRENGQTWSLGKNGKMVRRYEQYKS